jgi:hypothetical protein
MVKERVKIIGIAILIIIGIFVALFLIDFLILQPLFGYKSFLSFIFSTPIAYISLLAFAITLIIGCILPGRVGKIVRILSYIALFIFLLFVEIQIIKPFLKRTEVNLQVCSNFFSPSQTTGNIVYDVLAYSSCILSGYVPKDLSSIGWATFFIFYIILPFVFIWVFVYALMKEIFSGWGLERFSSLLSFIVAMYGARVLFGAVLLEFFAYGAWGLAGIFIAVFLVKGLEKIVEGMFITEELIKEVEMITKSKNEIRRMYAEYAYGILSNLTKIELNEKNKTSIYIYLLDLKKGVWDRLSYHDQQTLDGLITCATNAALNLDRESFKNCIDKLVSIIKSWKRLK